MCCNTHIQPNRNRFGVVGKTEECDMTNPKSTEITTADRLWRVLCAELGAIKHHEKCTCASEALKAAKELRNESELRNYLSGDQSLNQAVERVMARMIGLDSLTFGEYIFALVSGGVVMMDVMPYAADWYDYTPRDGRMGRHGNGHGEVGRDGNISGGRVPRHGQHQHEGGGH